MRKHQEILAEIAKLRKEARKLADIQILAAHAAGKFKGDVVVMSLFKVYMGFRPCIVLSSDQEEIVNFLVEAASE